MECNQVVPLLSSSADELILVVGRRPAPMFDETDELFDDADEDEDEHQSPIVNENSIWNSSINTTIHENNNTTSSSTTTATANNNTFSLLSQSKTSTV
jgi:hypothetical protein